ncbi:MAG: membrane protein insertion efficiency factor YidD [Clostridia bacterium]|nr:membrane protein insertion efficiency factor YidD [Clostridia bacterium]
MNKILNLIYLPFDWFFIGLVWLYKIFISPLKPKVCRFTPSCSSYMINSIKEFHFFKGILIGFKRLIKCNQKSKGGFDPIPTNIKGEAKWIL